MVQWVVVQSLQLIIPNLRSVFFLGCRIYILFALFANRNWYLSFCCTFNFLLRLSSLGLTTFMPWERVYLDLETMWILMEQLHLMECHLFWWVDVLLTSKYLCFSFIRDSSCIYFLLLLFHGFLVVHRHLWSELVYEFSRDGWYNSHGMLRISSNWYIFPSLRYYSNIIYYSLPSSNKVTKYPTLSVLILPTKYFERNTRSFSYDK